MYAQIYKTSFIMKTMRNRQPFMLQIRRNQFNSNTYDITYMGLHLSWKKLASTNQPGTELVLPYIKYN